MATKSYELPAKISIGNAGKNAQNFQPYRENFNVTLEGGDVVCFDAKSIGELFYYEKQLTEDFLVGVSEDGKVSTTAGSYDVSSGTFTAGGTSYSIVRNGDVFEVIGTIPYAAAEASLGLDAGNRFIIRITNSDITARSALPSGDICMTTNPAAAGGYNVYNKMAFETDGSLINVGNVFKDRPLEIKIKWTSEGEFTTYTFVFDKATFASAA